MISKEISSVFLIHTWFFPTYYLGVRESENFIQHSYYARRFNVITENDKLPHILYAQTVRMIKNHGGETARDRAIKVLEKNFSEIGKKRRNK